MGEVRRGNSGEDADLIDSRESKPRILQASGEEGSRLGLCLGLVSADSCSPALRCSKRSLQRLAP